MVAVGKTCAGLEFPALGHSDNKRRPVCVWMCFQLSVCVDETPQEAPPCRCSYSVCDVERVKAVWV